jgi:hypothetical protein
VVFPKFRDRVVATLAGLFLVLVAIANPADAHSVCVGTCNKVEVFGHVGVGVYDYSTDAGWKWIQSYGRSDVQYPYQREVGGFYIGNCYAAQVWQSNDGYNFGYYGEVWGPRKFTTTYWEFNKINVLKVAC